MYTTAQYVDTVGELNVATESGGNALVRAWNWVVEKITAFFKWLGDSMAKFYRWITGKSKKSVDSKTVVSDEEKRLGRSADRITPATATQDKAVKDEQQAAHDAAVADMPQIQGIEANLNILEQDDLPSGSVAETVRFFQSVERTMRFVRKHGWERIDLALECVRDVQAYRDKPTAVNARVLRKYAGKQVAGIIAQLKAGLGSLTLTPSAKLAKVFGVASVRDLDLRAVLQGLIQSGDLPADVFGDLSAFTTKVTTAKDVPVDFLIRDDMSVFKVINGTSAVVVPDDLHRSLAHISLDPDDNVYNSLVGVNLVQVYKEPLKGVQPNASGQYYCFADGSYHAKYDDAIARYSTVAKQIDEAIAAGTLLTRPEGPSDDVVTLKLLEHMHKRYERQLTGIQQRNTVSSVNDFIKSIKDPKLEQLAVNDAELNARITLLVPALTVYATACNKATVQLSLIHV